MFRRRNQPAPPQPAPARPTPVERITSVLGSGVTWKGTLRGSGGVRIEGAFEGEIHLRGLLVIGESGRVTCDHIRANVVIVAGAVRGDITAQKVEIRSSGRVWGDVVTAAFATEEGAFLRGQITMEERVEIAAPVEEPLEEVAASAGAAEEAGPAHEGAAEETAGQETTPGEAGASPAEAAVTYPGEDGEADSFLFEEAVPGQGEEETPESAPAESPKKRRARE